MIKKLNNRRFWFFPAICLGVAFLFFSLNSCGSRKVKAENYKTEQKSEVKISEKADSLAQAESETKTNVSTQIRDLGFTIKPIDGKPIDFKFLYNGNEVQGTATGEVYFNDKKEEKDSSVKIIEKTTTRVEKQDDEWLKAQVKEGSKIKEADRAEAWILYGIIVIVGVLAWEGANKLINKIKV